MVIQKLVGAHRQTLFGFSATALAGHEVKVLALNGSHEDLEGPSSNYPPLESKNTL